MNEINTINIWGIRIDEPIVTITDLLVTVVCFIAAYKIHKSGKKEKTFIYFKIYFFTMALATLFGGIIGHAFLYAFSFYWKLPGWILSMISIMFVERAVIEHTRILLNSSIVRILGIVNIIEFLTFVTLTIISLNFFHIVNSYLLFIPGVLESRIFCKIFSISRTLSSLNSSLRLDDGEA